MHDKFEASSGETRAIQDHDVELSSVARLAVSWCRASDFCFCNRFVSFLRDMCHVKL